MATWCLLLAAGAAPAADGVVVKYDRGKLVVKVDGEEKVVAFVKGRPHVHAADGKLLMKTDYPRYLKAGVKVELEEDDGTVTEVLIRR